MTDPNSYVTTSGRNNLREMVAANLAFLVYRRLLGRNFEE